MVEYMKKEERRRLLQMELEKQIEEKTFEKKNMNSMNDR